MARKGSPLVARDNVREDLMDSDARITMLLAVIEDAHRHLVNVQPHIPEACYPGHEIFIDSHVDMAIKVLGAALADAPETTA